VKEAKERRENEAWAQNQIAQVLYYVPLETAIRLFARSVEEGLGSSHTSGDDEE